MPYIILFYLFRIRNFGEVDTMSRFVMVSFVFLGWTFYEMSGGSDFVAPDRPTPLTVAKSHSFNEPQVTAASLVPKPLIQPGRQPVLQPRSSTASATLPYRPDADPNLRSQVALAQMTAVGDGFKIGLDTLVTPPNTPSLQLASLNGGLAPLANRTVASADNIIRVERTETATDLRQVTASRVNMRNGPGTIHAVVAQLNRDATVEVLEDRSTGWLRLRVVEDDQTGWIAASLISKKRP